MLDGDTIILAYLNITFNFWNPVLSSDDGYVGTLVVYFVSRILPLEKPRPKPIQRILNIRLHERRRLFSNMKLSFEILSCERNMGL